MKSFTLPKKVLEWLCRTQVVELITGLHTLKVSPLCPQNLSLPAGWQDFLDPVIAENYGIISGEPAPEVRYVWTVCLLVLTIFRISEVPSPPSAGSVPVHGIIKGQPHAAAFLWRYSHCSKHCAHRCPLVSGHDHCIECFLHKHNYFPFFAAEI